MDQINSAAEANRGFSKILRDVQGGSSYVVTAHGKPVARIVPFDAAEIERAAAWEALLERLAGQPATDMGPWTRDDLYDDCLSATHQLSNWRCTSVCNPFRAA